MTIPSIHSVPIADEMLETCKYIASLNGFEDSGLVDHKGYSWSPKHLSWAQQNLEGTKFQDWYQAQSEYPCGGAKLTHCLNLCKCMLPIS